jgi:anti-sigma factor RsiW
MNDAMGDMGPELSTEEMAELSALADGTLAADRRAAVEARVAASPRLQELLERQRRAVAAAKVLADEPVPDSLRAGVDERASARSRRGRRAGWRFAPGLAIGGAAAAVAAILVVAIGGGPAGPSVADAARLADLPPSGPAPARVDGSARLAIGVEGVAFPDLLRSHGWRAVGVRRGRIDGRDATAVYYAKGSRRIAYVIVAGSGLPHPAGARRSTRGGVEYRSLHIGGRPAVTWRRAGHTCVLIGPISPGELLTLAARPPY